jgi:hypothetical protein
VNSHRLEAVAFLQPLLVIAVIALALAVTYLRGKLWSIMFPNQDFFPFLGPKKIQKLFDDSDDGTRPRN